MEWQNGIREKCHALSYLTNYLGVHHFSVAVLYSQPPRRARVMSDTSPERSRSSLGSRNVEWGNSIPTNHLVAEHGSPRGGTTPHRNWPSCWHSAPPSWESLWRLCLQDCSAWGRGIAACEPGQVPLKRCEALSKGGGKPLPGYLLHLELMWHCTKEKHIIIMGKENLQHKANEWKLSWFSISISRLFPLLTSDHGDFSRLCVHHHHFTVGDGEKTRGGCSSLVHTGQPANHTITSLSLRQKFELGGKGIFNIRKTSARHILAGMHTCTISLYNLSKRTVIFQQQQKRCLAVPLNSW